MPIYYLMKTSWEVIKINWRKKIQVLFYATGHITLVTNGKILYDDVISDFINSEAIRPLSLEGQVKAIYGLYLHVIIEYRETYSSQG